MRFSNAFDKLFPVEVYYCNIQSFSGMNLLVPNIGPIKGWGNPSIELVKNEQDFLPEICRCIYLSAIDEKIYQFNDTINFQIKKIYTEMQNLLNKDEDIAFVVGCAPFGGIAFWLYNENKSILLSWQHGQECLVDIKKFKIGNIKLSLKSYCQELKRSLGIPADTMFLNNGIMNSLMKQYTYRYLISDLASGGLEDISFNIENILFDGTHDKLNNGHLMQYHSAGIPKRIKCKLNIAQTELSLYYWMNLDSIINVFERFYGAHPETKADFIIRIDVENKKYELALYRQGLKEPVVIPESAYQLIVFKNKFEDYRSENYNQPRGAWIW